MGATGAIISLPALLVFPVGYVLLALLLSRHGTRWPGLLVGVGGGGLSGRIHQLPRTTCRGRPAWSR